MEQPQSGRLFKAGPSIGRLIGGVIVLRGWAGVALDRSVLHDHHTLRLLAVNNDRLYDALLSCGGCLPKDGMGVCQYTHQHQGKDKFLRQISPLK